MGMSGVYGAASDAESLATIQEAIDAGVNLLDTSDFYSTYSNEMLIGRALRSRRDRVVLSVTFNAQPAPYGLWQGIAGRQAALKTELTSTMKRLGVSYIDIYRLGRLNPDAPIEETLGTISEMVGAGYVRHIGLSGLAPDAIRRASLQCPIVDYQVEYSLANRAPETKIFPKLEELGLGATVYGVLARGLLSSTQPAAVGDLRAQQPRFKGENLDRARQLAIRLREIAGDRGVTPAQLATAWVLARQDWVVPLMRVRTRTQLAETLGALELELTAEEIAAIQAPVREKTVAEPRLVGRQMEIPDRKAARMQPAEPLRALPVKAAVEKIVAIEAPVRVIEVPVPAKAVAQTRKVGRRIEVPESEKAPWQFAEAARALPVSAAAEKIPAIEAPVLAVEEPVPTKAAAETRRGVELTEIPERENAPAQPAETASAPPVIPAAEEIAAIETPVFAIEGPVPVIEEPAPAMAAAETLQVVEQIAIPESENAPAQPAEAVCAMPEIPAAQEIEAPVFAIEEAAPVIEEPTPAMAAADRLQVVEQIEIPESEKATVQPAEAVCAMPEIPAAQEMEGPVLAIEAPAPVIEEPAPAMAAADTLQVVEQIAIPESEKATVQPAEAVYAMPEILAAQEMEAPVLAIEEPAQLQAAAETLQVVEQIAIPESEKAPVQPAQTASAALVMPRWEEIAAIEAPVPAKAVAEPRFDAPPMKIPASEETRTEPAKTLNAPLANPAAEEIAATEATLPARAVEEKRQNGRQIRSLARKVSQAASMLVRDRVQSPGPQENMASDGEKSRKRGASPLVALDLGPAAEEIAATEAPVPLDEALIPTMAAAETGPVEPPMPVPDGDKTPVQQAEAMSALQITPAEEKSSAIEAAPAAIEAPVPATVAAEALHEGRQKRGQDGPKRWTQLAAAMRELHVIPAAEEINAIEAAIPSVEVLGPAIAAPQPQGDGRQSKSPDRENPGREIHGREIPGREKKRTQPAVTEGAQRVRPTEKDIAAIEAALPADEALAPAQAAAQARPVVRPMQAQDRENPRAQLAAMPDVERVKPPAEQTAAIEAPLPAVETPVAAKAAAETHVDNRQVQPPASEEPRMQPAVTLSPPPAKPAAEKITVTEAPIPVTEAAGPATEPPVAAKAAGGTRREGRQKRSLDSEKTWAQLAETLGALRAKPAAEKLTVTEAAPPVLEAPAPVKAVAETSEVSPPAPKLDSEKTWAQLTETLDAMRARPGATEIAANKAPTRRKASPEVRRRALQEQFQEEEEWSQIHAWATSRHYIPKALR